MTHIGNAGRVTGRTTSKQCRCTASNNSGIWGRIVTEGVDGCDEGGSVLIFALVFLVAVSVIVTALAGWARNDLKNTVNFEANRTVLYASAGATEVAIWSVRYNAPTTLTTSLTAGELGITSLAVTALPVAIASGGSVTIGSGSTAQTVTTLGAPIGATAISVASFTSTYSQPSGTVVTAFACPGSSANSSAAGQAITVSGQAIAVWCTTKAPTTALAPPNNFVTRIVKVTACPDSETQATCTANPFVKAVIYLDDYSNSTGSTPGTIECNSGDESTCGTGMSVNSWVDR